MKKNDIAIKIEHVTKRYFSGSNYQPNLLEWIEAIVTGNNFKRPQFKAIDDLSLTIKRGQVVGFIGSNGAGKSTLLKLINKITFPNEGTIEINGTVAGLLELGAGFHGELTGKENVQLYGTILGLSKEKIRKIYDDVVDFAGLHEFMDTPYRHYSSGMKARLAFSISIFVEPDILLIDEVLAVGDINFQKKCIKFMKNYCKDPNHTVIFVSHQNQNVKAICDHLVWLEHGKIKTQGPTDKILKEYIKFQDERDD